MTQCYQMPLGNVQSYNASGGKGFAQTVRVPSHGGGVWPNRHVTFIVADKA